MFQFTTRLSRTLPTASVRPGARLLHVSRAALADSDPAPSGSGATADGGRRTSSYDTPSGTRDPFKTTVSGTPSNDQGTAMPAGSDKLARELHAASSNPNPEDAAPSPEEKMNQGRGEATQTGLIGG
jgi:hypothetical protein